MDTMTRFLASRWGIVLAGALIGGLAVLLQYLGNPPNMGICVACMERDVVGALGFHRAEPVQYLRPEILGLVLGAFAGSLLFREFRSRGGSAPAIRFVLGFFAMSGALVFLGCPWRMLLRIAGGDWNGLVGLSGIVAGIGAGTLFLRGGYSLGRSQNGPAASGLLWPVLAAALLALLLAGPKLATGVLFASTQGPGSLHAPVWISFVAAIVVGLLAQRTRFCTVGGLRDLLLVRNWHLLSGAAALVVTAFVLNLVLGKFNPGFQGQPIAHSSHLWNFLGMALAGLAFVLAGGCPGRQLILAGEGDQDAGIFALGMLSGAAFAHNFGVASSPAGPGPWGPAAVLAGLAICSGIGLFMRGRACAQPAGTSDQRQCPGAQ
jgi:YedE family putative selenium metabolism protein